MKKKNKNPKRSLQIPALAVIAVLAGTMAYAFLSPLSSSSEKEYVYIDNDDNADSITKKISDISGVVAVKAFNILAGATGYYEHIRSGRYCIEPDEPTLQVFRKIRNGSQEPVMLTVPSVRTLDRLAHELSKKLMMNEDELYGALIDQEVCKSFGLDTLTIQCLFIPETYEIYWNIPIEKFLERMNKERKAFWTEERKKKAKEAGMTEEEVVTLASIVDEETANNGEKPMIAGMYINRLKTGMPLQADPTIKYALKDFSLKRIYHNHLDVKSPFNTYRNTGLPPGPIRIPSIAGIDAVLNHTKSNYLYMCAKEDFSGTHNFAVTYQEHLQNAAKYSAALNKRGIK